jgi:hypothetical protein
MGGGLDGAIGTTGTTVEQQLHQAAGGGGAEGGGNREGRPIKITATTVHHHQGTAVGARRGMRQGGIRQQAKRRLRGRMCGPWKEQTHGRV